MERSFVLLVALSLVAVVSAQSCVPLTDPNVATLRALFPMCDVEWDIISAQNNLFFLPSNPLNVSYTTQPCLSLAIRFGCSLVFRVCNNTFQTAVTGIPSTTLPLPSAPCRTQCNDITRLGCDQLISRTLTEIGQPQAIPLLLPNCASPATDPRLAGQPAFPDDTQPNPIQLWTLQLPAGNGSFVTRRIPAICQSFPNAFEQTPATFPCFRPWTSTPADDLEGYCDQTCPSATFPESTYKKEALVAMILGWLGYVSTFFVFVTMMMMPRYRAYPAMLVPILLVGSHIISFGFIFAAIGGYRWVICENGYTQSGTSNGKCVFNGLTIVFGALLTTYTWCLIAINSALVLVFRQEELLTSKATKFVSIGVIFALTALSCIVALATKSIAYQRGLLFCFLHDEVDDESFYKPFTWQYPLLIAPLGICILISTVCMVLVLIKLSTLRFGGEKGVTVEKFVRVGLFLFIFLALYSFVFAFRFVNTVHANTWVKYFKDWSAAAITTPNAPYPGDKPSTGLAYAFAWAIACQGVLISLLFGSTSDVLTFWCTLRKRHIDEDDNAYGLMSDRPEH